MAGSQAVPGELWRGVCTGLSHRTRERAGCGFAVLPPPKPGQNPLSSFQQTFKDTVEQSWKNQAPHTPLLPQGSGALRPKAELPKHPGQTPPRSQREGVPPPHLRTKLRQQPECRPGGRCIPLIPPRLSPNIPPPLGSQGGGGILLVGNHTGSFVATGSTASQVGNRHSCPPKTK